MPLGIETVIRIAVLAYFVGALLSGIAFVILDIKNNLSYARINLLHSLSRLPLVMVGWPFWLCVFTYLKLTKNT